MRLVAVSIVKNEADIIEAFVRHTLAWVDHQLIFDHDSTDGTRQILGALKAEGLPISLFTDDALGNLQQFRSNYLTRLAAADYGASWVLPLDADEILSGKNRAGLEATLADFDPTRPASLLLLNYYPTKADDASVENPVLRLRHCQTSPSRTKKIMVPHALALDPEVMAGKGSHALYRNHHPLSDQPLPADYHLCHLALRSPQHQALRVVLAELQKLSRGKAHAGLDLHYRLGFQLLAENPDLFFATVCPAPTSLQLKPIQYRGGAISSHPGSSGWNRVTRALLPFLEKLAVNHGRLTDAGIDQVPSTTESEGKIRELRVAEISKSPADDPAPNFSGFTAHSGWGPPEGPVPEAFLPPFHWGYAPATDLLIQSDRDRSVRLLADALTYSEGQSIHVELNGSPVLQHVFARTNQKDTLSAGLSLQRGENRLVFHYGRHLTTEYDSRKLAVIYLSLRISEPDAS